MAAAARHLLNPLATPEQIARTPSREDGIAEALETDLRAYGALLIQQVGIQLKAPQVLMTTASVLFQRFWYVSSMRSFSVKVIAASALFLASKLEEHPIRIRDLINCFDYLIKLVQHEASQLALERARSVASGLSNNNSNGTHTLPASTRHALDGDGGGVAASATAAAPTHSFVYQPMDYFAKEFYDWKDEIVIGESQILKRLGFNTTVQNPYGSIVNYLQVLDLTDHPTIPQRAWSLANDFLLTPVLSIYPPHTISVTCVYLACLFARTQVALPRSPAPWFELFDVSSEEEIWEVSRVLLDLYRHWTGDLGWVFLEEKEGEDGHGGHGGHGGGQLQQPRPHHLGPPLGQRRTRTVWRRAAELRLPVTKEEVRSLLKEGSNV